MKRSFAELNEESDALLVGRIANGDTDAVAVLIRRYERPLKLFLDRVINAASDDLFQETWIRAVRAIHRFDPSLPFSPWLFRIAWNLVRSEYKRRESEPSANASTIDAVDERHDAASVAEELLTKERAERVRTLIAELPPPMAEAVMLRYFEELSEKEMAQRLGVPAGTIKSRLHHAMRRLTTVFTEEFS